MQEWWRTFNDPVLEHLVAEAQRVNPDVRTAGLRIMEARAQLGIAGSTLYPQVQQATGEVLGVGEHPSGAPDTTARGRQRRAAGSAGNSISGASSGAASSPRMPAISPASPSTTTCRC